MWLLSFLEVEPIIFFLDPRDMGRLKPFTAELAFLRVQTVD